MVKFGGDTELSVFDLNEIYMASEASHQQDRIDATGYHNPQIAGLLLARIFNPMIIVASVEKALGMQVPMNILKSYLQHRGNMVLLENIQNATELWEIFNETFDFSAKTPKEAFKEMIDLLYMNAHLLTEEGVAVLKFLRFYIKPMLKNSGVYERIVKNGVEMVVTYDQYFADQLNRFGQLMLEPHALPATMNAFLVDGMYGAGKRRTKTHVYMEAELPVSVIDELDAAFNKAYETLNCDGGLDELCKQEKQRAMEDAELVVQSLDAIRDAGGDETVWEEFVSDGIVDSTWEAILEMEGLGQIK
jgi:hypothetical protein